MDDASAALKDTTERLGSIPERQTPNMEAFSPDRLLEQELIESDASGSWITAAEGEKGLGVMEKSYICFFFF